MWCLLNQQQTSDRSPLLVISGNDDSCQQFSFFHPENQHQIDLTLLDQIWYLESNPQGTENSVFVHKFENRIIIFFSEPFCFFLCSACEKLLQRCVRCGINPITQAVTKLIHFKIWMHMIIINFGVLKCKIHLMKRKEIGYFPLSD